MSDRYPGGIITKTPVTPTGPYAEGSATGVWTLEQQAYWTAQGLWPQASNPTPNDPYFQYVTSLLHGDGTNSGQNNTFLDSSTNAFTITRNGNTTQGSFSPYGSNWGNYLNGSSYFNIASNAAFALPGDFTWEAWVYVTTSGVETIYHGNTTDSLIVKIDSSNRVVVRQFAVADLITTTTTVPTNNWVHIAVARSGTSMAVWINGAIAGTATSSTSFATSAVYIGADDGGNNKLSGYISNLRLVKGTAVYNPSSSTITVPTTPLTAISGTSLLTCQSNRFIDASTNAFTLTVNSAPQVTRFSPFAPTYSTQYSTSTIGGSGYFDGSGDYLSIANNAALHIGSSDFTLETWVYLNSTSNQEILVKAANSSTYPEFELRVESSKMKFYASSSSSAYALQFAGATTLTTGQWYHVAVTRSGSSWTIWLNGASDGTGSSSATIYSNTDAVTVSAYANGTTPLNGYVTDSRLVIGTSLYSTTFTPPTTPLTAVSNTQLLCNMTNAAIYDNSMIPDWETVGTASINTGIYKYGTGSIGNFGQPASPAGYLKPNSNSNAYAFGSGNWTIEFWMYNESYTGSQTFYDGRPTSTDGYYVTIRKPEQDGNQYLYFSTNGVDRIISRIPISPRYYWRHVALCKAGNTTKMFINGTECGSYTDTNTYLNGTQRPLIGSNGYTPNSESPTAYIDDLRITKGYARYWENFTPPSAALPNFSNPSYVPTQDAQFNYTTMLLPGNGTNGAQNNTFLDSSTNAFTITRNGNTTQGTFTPFSQTGWSNNFNGTNSYFSLPNNSALQLGSGDFTIETWFYRSNSDTTSGVLFDFGWLSTSGWGLYIDDTIQFRIGNSDKLQFSPIALYNKWVHIAITRSSGTIYMFINGTQVRSNTDSSNLTNTTALMGASSGPSNYFNGYLSNTRIIKGTALYTSNFTPSTTPLTAVSGTSLLTCQSNRFVDNSTNAFAITVGGNPSVQAFSPFAPTAAYSASTVGGSGYFDGSGDYLSIADSSALQLQGTSFTIEGWFYAPSFGGSGGVTCLGSNYGGSSAGWYIQIDNAATAMYAGLRGDPTDISASTTVNVNAWNHFALSGTSGSTSSVKLYLNGSQIGSTYTGSASMNSGGAQTTLGALYSGSSYVQQFGGYISNFRILKGTALYTGSTYTVPTAPLTAVTNTSLLLSCTNAGITDATAKNDLETVGNAQISNTTAKFGSTSIYLDGTGDYLQSANNPNLIFNTGDFTIECWVYVNSIDSGNANPIVSKLSSSSSSGWLLGISSGGLWQFSTYSGLIINRGNSVSTNTWYHLAVTRFGSTVTMYVNGMVQSSGTASTDFSDTAPLMVGYSQDFANLNGYVQDLRITKGYARYVQPFTPPTQAFQLY